MNGTARTWTGSLHQTFRLLPAPSSSLKVFLSSDGCSPQQVLSSLPYEAARSQTGGAGTGLPDPKRYRDPKAVYQTVGLVYEDRSGVVRVTELGAATLRWIDILSPKNVVVLGRYAAYALAACQLRNPTGSGRVYHPSVNAFPFSYIWRAMLALDDKITSEELNCALFYAIDEPSLQDAVERISRHRADPGAGALRPEVLVGARKNDRIVPWISLASFGYSLIQDKRESDSIHYRIRPEARRLLQEASQIKHRHRDFVDTTAYVRHISASACLPKDVR
ncbi:hypothetical protein [Micromonospora fulviviridis]|uniref:hypothetical protein n=1 Tax=Micromonospora fulviviridis TaxID=47860 RepID=UPI0037B73550